MTEKQYGIIKDSLVINTAIFDNPDESVIEYFKEIYSADAIIECNNYVVPGFTWNGTSFIEPQPYPSWIYNSETNRWNPPVEYPEDGKAYTWDEATLSWIEE